VVIVEFRRAIPALLGLAVFALRLVLVDREAIEELVAVCEGALDWSEVANLPAVKHQVLEGDICLAALLGAVEGSRVVHLLHKGVDRIYDAAELAFARAALSLIRRLLDAAQANRQLARLTLDGKQGQHRAVWANEAYENHVLP
jgi:hypothetical protein